MRFSLPEFRDYRSQASSFEALEATRGEEGVLSERGNPPQSYSMQRASSGIFNMMHIPPVLGRGFCRGMTGRAPRLFCCLDMVCGRSVTRARLR